MTRPFSRAVLVAIAATALVVGGLSAPAQAKAKPWKVSATPDRTSTAPGVPVTVTGKVRPKAAKKRVRLQVAVGAGWQDVAVGKTTKRSRFTLTWAPTASGVYTLRVRKPKGGGHQAGSSPVVVLSVPSPAPVVPTALALGWYHGCALMTNGTVRCWGRNDLGQLGRGTVGTTGPTPVEVPGLSGVVSLASGENHTCAALASGRVACWGKGSDGQLGNGGTSTAFSPALIPAAAISTATQVTAGRNHTCALLADQTVTCWGDRSSPSDNQLTPAAVGLGGIAQISAGEYFTCARSVGGAAGCWGDDTNGRLGNGAGGSSTTPAGVVGASSGVTAISAGLGHACAVKTGQLVCWGANAHGQVGDGTSGADRQTIVNAIGSDAVAVSAGSNHTCARTGAGLVKCWGDNQNEWLAVGSVSSNVTSPATVAGISNATPSTGYYYSCALAASGAVSCWGRNADGELARGTTDGGADAPGATVGLT
ncbi:MAG: regulator of chromosome condensation [Nocardioidaceae bacterium]|nr:regulator of chromosome condensation [Nocardioidaceae bacterium]